MSLKGMMRVVQFNWPMYLFAAFVFVLLVALSTQVTSFPMLGSLLLVGAAMTLFQSLASLAASHWVYDLSPLHDWHFLKDLPGETAAPGRAPHRIVVVHAGYDETDGKILNVFPGSEIIYVDFFPDLGHREPSIIKARTLYPPKQKATCFSIHDWSIDEESADLIVIAFAAHELRDAVRREQMFRQARTTLAAEGRIVLVEHVRNTPNFIAFNIGAFHFFPLRIWRQAIAAANLRISSSFKITPLVEVLVLCR